MGKKKSKDPNGFPKKLYKLLGEGVAEEMNAMSSKELDATMVDAEEKIDEVIGILFRSEETTLNRSGGMKSKGKRARAMLQRYINGSSANRLTAFQTGWFAV